ncbi:MAG: hypothetical protein DMF89_21035 [Acidobacteria bacterium]|nr:MAG: hypothetical protein DMF89_21035 [Acidobacteriota bacterium]
MNAKSLWMLAVGLWMLLVPLTAHAQETNLSGTVTDATDAVLPGVTVTGTHTATGNTFVAVTDAEGRYRLPTLRPGVYRVTAELTGFNTVIQDGLELLVGQQGVRNFKLTLSGVQESITVKSETPLIELKQSRLGGNIDTRQVEEMPLNGRNWMSLVTMAPGARVNGAGASSVTPYSTDTPNGNQPGGFQINMDGQQVTTNWSVVGMGSPHFSRDAIAEFQLVSSRFDATQGRSTGVQVNAVSKSGTNRYAGSLSGYFRDSSLNAEDPILNRVVPYSDQQVSGTFGGPIEKDRIHFFGNYEYERSPNTIIPNVPYPVFNTPPAGAGDVKTTTRQNYYGGRVDWVLNQNNRLLFRGSGFTFTVPVQGVGTAHPSSWSNNIEASGQAFVSWTRTSKRMVNDLKGGYNGFHDEIGRVVPGDVPTFNFAGGFTVGRVVRGLFGAQKALSVRDDLTLFRGRHELKMGGEFIHPSSRLYYGSNPDGSFDATLGPVPANIGALFPVWNDPSTWNLAGIPTSIVRNYTRAIGTFEIHCLDSPETCRRRRPDVGTWFQDNWNLNSRLTVNLGIRWDFSQDGMGQDFVYPYSSPYPAIPPIHEKQPQDLSNWGPRTGIAYALNERTVLRGGWGLYYGGVTDRNSHASFINIANTNFTVNNDGRPNFVTDPFNLSGGGKVPTLADAQAAAAARGIRPGTSSIIYNARTPYSYQTSAGLQHQITQSLAVQADYVWLAGRREPAARNINLSFDPATGVNFPFTTDIAHRPFPNLGAVNVWTDSSYSNYHGLETAVTKRFSDRWQAALTYTLSGTYNYYPEPINPGCVGPVNGLTMTCDVYFGVPRDLGGEYGLRGAGGVQTLGEPDQRHRFVFNGVYELRGGFQVSGLYFYSSGVRQQTTYGRDIRDVGLAEYGGGRLRPDGSVIGRNSVTDDPIHRVDLRLQWRLTVGRVSIMPLAEVFNLFNSDNFTRNWTELNPFYGQPTGQTIGSGYRVVQLGFRTQF